MPLRKIIAYSLIVLLVVAFTGWAWLNRRHQRLERKRRHGPRPD